MEKKSPVDIGVTKEMFQPNASPLNSEELSNASQELIRKYPQVARSADDPPIGRQSIANLSFMLLNEPKDGIYGFVKVRGVWENEDMATQKGEELIKMVDSVFPIHQAQVGRWAPITNNPKYTSDKLDVKTKEQEIALRDKAAKENLAKNQQQRREIEEQREAVKRDDIDADPNSLDFYTKKRVSQKELKGYINQGLEKLRLLKKQLKKIDKEVLELNKNHPQYIDLWLENYNKQRRKVGLPDLTEEDLNKISVVGPIDV